MMPMTRVGAGASRLCVIGGAVAASVITSGAHTPSTQATLTVRQPAAAVAPIGVRLDGIDTREARFSDLGVALLTDLPAGAWSMVPVYAGDVTGHAQRVTLVDGQRLDVTLPVERVGAFRFHAASGMCEAPDTWALNVAATRPEGVTETTPPRPPSKTCLREVAGLWPGTYTVSVVPPPDVLPPYRVSVTVREQVRTDVDLTWPEVLVTGSVTPFHPGLIGVPVEFAPFSPSPRTSAVTFSAPRISDAGRYVAALPRSGAYLPQIRSGAAVEWAHPVDVEFPPGVTEFPIQIGGHLLEVQFTEAGGTPSRAATGTLTLEHRDGSKATHRISDLSQSFALPGLRTGTYVMAVTAQGLSGRVTAREVQVIEFMPDTPRQRVVVELAPRFGSIEVVNGEGAALPGAHVYARPPSLSTITDDKGLLDLSVFPTGTDLTIRTSQWATTCHRVTALSVQRIVVPDATDELTLVVPPEPTPDARPLRGRESAALSTIRISGLPGATCPVAWSDLPVMRAKDPSGPAYIVTLPRGTYTLTLLNGRQFTVQVPGRLELPR